MIGKTLAHYEITSLLGKGGMGEVYCARDTRLGRNVAIKILPGHLMKRTEIRERFEREARLISSLSHPHVCALYDVGHDNGVDYLVMEYLEGETLADRLASRGTLPAADVARLGIEIASALAAAHKHGIVHRDLKPGNVMLTASGVKLLDFGLAKATASSDSSDPAFTSIQTVAGEPPLTQEGTILGTMQYMSPEQLEGKDVDSRSDIFALGLLLYEMVSGKRAFHGDSQASLIAAIMSSEPTSIMELVPVTPPALDRLVKACIAKDPDRRVQSAHDVQLQLEWITQASGEIDAPRIAKRRPRWGWITSALLSAVVAFLLVNMMRVQDVTQQTTRLSLVPPLDLRLSSEPIEIAISTDGSMVAYLAADSTGTQYLWVRALHSLESVRLPGTKQAYTAFWSPDAKHLAFFQGSRLMRVSVVGNRSPRMICDATSGRGGSWNRDGVIVFAAQSSGPIYSVPASGGTPTQITFLDVADGETAHRYPEFLPNGNDFLFASLRNTQHETFLGSLDGSAPVRLLSADGMATYASPGYLIYQRSDALLAVPFDVKTRALSGEPFALEDRPGGTRDYFGSMAVRSSHMGAIIYPETRFETELRWVDRFGEDLGSLSLPPDYYRNPTLSPDGTKLAVRRDDAKDNAAMWTVELERTAMQRVSFGLRTASFGIWSADGEELTFTARAGHSQNIYVSSKSGTADVELLLKTESLFLLPQAWSADQRYLVIRDLRPETNNDLLIYSVENQELRPFIQTAFNEMDASISHNGKWIAYRSDESGQSQVYVQPFPELGRKIQISVDGVGVRPSQRTSRIHWGPNDDEILYLGSDARTMMRVPLEMEPDPRPGRAEALFRLPVGHMQVSTIDNQRFLVAVKKTVRQQLTIVTNWAAGLDQE